MKRFLTLTVLFLLLIGTMPVAHAQESIPEVSTLSELQDAIAQAEEGDTIKVMQTIVINEPVNIGIMNKHITIMAYGTVDTMFSVEGDWTDAVWFYNLTISGDFSGINASKVKIDTKGSVYFQNIFWETCQVTDFGGALKITQGSVYMSGGGFNNCISDLGGAVYVDTNGAFYPAQSLFTSNSAKREGGAIYSCGTLMADQCIFEYNSAEEKGGAICGLNTELRGCKIRDNRAEMGGGLYTTGASKLRESKVYRNTADIAGADMFVEGELTIDIADYSALFAEEFAAESYSTVGWYTDTIESRYSPESLTMAITGTNCADTALIMVFDAPTPIPEPEPEPEPEPTPTPIPDPEPSHSSSRRPQKVEPKPIEPKYPSLACGKAKLEGENVVYLIDALKRFTPAQERLTRGRAAALLYGLMNADSQAECDKIAVDCYDDLYGSPYQKVVSALAGAGVFCGQSDSSFKADSIMTYGQLLTVLTRFVEPKEGYIGSFNVLDHWAAPAAVTAASYGWIEDVPIDLNAPATYGAFVNLLIKIYDL